LKQIDAGHGLLAGVFNDGRIFIYKPSKSKFYQIDGNLSIIHVHKGERLMELIKVKKYEIKNYATQEL
jgi:hypothetical protein